MSPLSALVTRFLSEERGSAVLLSREAVTALAVAATLFYARYADIASVTDTDTVMMIDADTVITHSEWALIRPLFLLYVERETALQMEATSMMGAGSFGRSSSEVGTEIAQLEADLPRRVFYFPAFTV